MKIYVFERPDGSRWADFSEDHASRFKILETFDLQTRADYELLIDTADMPRVRALAERAYAEFMARNQQPEPIVTPTPVLMSLKDRGFWGRVKWLVMGV